MKTIRNIMAGLGLLAATILQAQDMTNIDWATASDLQVELHAVEQLPTIPAADATNGNTFYSAQNAGVWPPMPADIFNFPVWDLGNGNYLLSDENYHYHHHHKAASASLSSSSTMVMAADDSPVLPGGDEDTNDDYFPMLMGVNPIDTNELYLQVSNVINGTVDLNLYNATNFVYSIWSTTNLTTPFSEWQVETEVFPSNTNSMPFTVQTQGRTNLFMDAEDWTGVTSGGNTTPDWWLWDFYQTTDLSDTNLDSIGSPLLRDYQNNIDPNIVFFTLQFPEQTGTNIVNGSITITGGKPSYMAVLVNDANPADAVWEPYTSTNLTVNLDWGDGFYNINVGMRGMASNSTITWSGVRVAVYRPALILTVTNPISSTVSQPMIQLQGLANKTLSSLTYDVSNALGVVSNQTGYWQASFYDTNVESFTTNSFQCYDIPLTNGLNTITLHATDMAGNTLTTNYSYDLEYTTNPPVLSILWPPNGTLISGNNFNLQAQVDDDTATVIAVMNGQTNTGLVERSGKVWVNNIPMAAGTNILAVTATDAAGNTTTTNLTLSQSAVFVTLDPLPAGELNQPFVDVTGGISETNEDVCITVNGTNAYYLDDMGDWEADNVPVNPTGMATFDIELYTNDPVNIGSENNTTTQPAVMGLLAYTSGYYNNETFPYGCADSRMSEVADNTTHWNYTSGGAENSTLSGLNGDCQPQNTTGSYGLPGGLNGFTPTWEINSYGGSYENPPYWFLVPFWDYWTYIKAYADMGYQSSSADAQVGVIPGGPAIPGQKALYLVMAQVFDEDLGFQLTASDFQFKNQKPGTSVVDVGDMSEGLVTGPAGAPVSSPPLTYTPENISFDGMTVSNVTVQLTVVSNSATQVDATNWAVVKSLTNDYVYVQALLSVTNITDPTNLASYIQWSGGEPVPGNPLQRMVTKTNSVETTISASVNAITNSLNVWVIWGTIQVLTTGSNPTNAPQFDTVEDGTEILGIRYFDSGNSVAGKICAVATVSPAGIHSVVTNGWSFTQMKWTETFVDGAIDSNWSFPPWTGDGPFSGNFTTVLDVNDKLYTIDGPSFPEGFDNATNSVEMYKNFYDYITWNSQTCSDTNTSWHFEGKWNATETPQFNSLDVGIDPISLP